MHYAIFSQETIDIAALQVIVLRVEMGYRGRMARLHLSLMLERYFHF